ncbi:hypothetical protein Tco_1250245 [Tanacetum coccineum]
MSTSTRRVDKGFGLQFPWWSRGDDVGDGGSTVMAVVLGGCGYEVEGLMMASTVVVADEMEVVVWIKVVIRVAW